MAEKTSDGKSVIATDCGKDVEMSGRAKKKQQEYGDFIFEIQNVFHYNRTMWFISARKRTGGTPSVYFSKRKNRFMEWESFGSRPWRNYSKTWAFETRHTAEEALSTWMKEHLSDSQIASFIAERMLA